MYKRRSAICNASPGVGELRFRKIAKPEIFDGFVVFLQSVIYTAQTAYFQLEKTNVLKALLVLEFAFMQRHIQNLDFLVQERQFVVASYELRSDYITLLYHLQ